MHGANGFRIALSGAQSLPVAFDVLHLLGTAVWTGGLLAMALSLPLASEAGTRSALLRRFSIVALAGGSIADSVADMAMALLLAELLKDFALLLAQLLHILQILIERIQSAGT